MEVGGGGRGEGALPADSELSMLPGCGESLFLRDSQHIIEFCISKRGGSGVGSGVPRGTGHFPAAFQPPPWLIPLERQIGRLPPSIPDPRSEFGDMVQKGVGSGNVRNSVLTFGEDESLWKTGIAGKKERKKQTYMLGTHCVGQSMAQ